jgi:hypothetical protein
MTRYGITFTCRGKTHNVIREGATPQEALESLYESYEEVRRWTVKHGRYIVAHYRQKEEA